MTTYNLPDSLDSLHLTLQEQADDSLTIVCYCAAWCNTCKAYQPQFDELSALHPQHCFVWVDIEENEELLGDEDVDNFPTVLIQNKKGTLFFGPLLPHIEHLQRLLEHAAETPVQHNIGPGDFKALVAAAAQ
ncbi:thioredoxin family protein [Paenalcaligenes niemegkensis]|uniref:thioredoxin family protein n=1 Tax=Paenalcaligenes niemegkensis TaxID=2895469 RepID=UPI001EE8AC03|nr:thioredoxin family protein [Paenalcaligenes niemegkensis]MCQ9617102.1 thioredoxin family protein [Paenalcaligenes niemegkensis]